MESTNDVQKKFSLRLYLWCRIKLVIAKINLAVISARLKRTEKKYRQVCQRAEVIQGIKSKLKMDFPFTPDERREIRKIFGWRKSREILKHF